MYGMTLKRVELFVDGMTSKLDYLCKLEGLTFRTRYSIGVQVFCIKSYELKREGKNSKIFNFLNIFSKLDWKFSGYEMFLACFDISS